MKLEKIERKSPTLGMRAPKGATVLLDGKSFDEWESSSGKPIQWEIVGDGSVRVSDKKNNGWISVQRKNSKASGCTSSL